MRTCFGQNGFEAPFPRWSARLQQIPSTICPAAMLIASVLSDLVRVPETIFW
jgi:hypothetical protein